MTSPEWLVERGIGETRAALIADGAIVEARVERDDVVPAGTIIAARLASIGVNGRNALARGGDGVEYLLPRLAGAVAEGRGLAIQVTREAIPGSEPWKRPLARITDSAPAPARPLAAQLEGREIAFPSPQDLLGAAGWDELVEEARSGIVRFSGGELRIEPTSALTVIDVDGPIPPDELAVLGASAAGRAIRRLDIGGSIGIDLPTAGSRSARLAAAAAIDAALPQPFERTAVNGFGFVQIVRPRRHPSLVELAQDRAAFEARALLRRAGRQHGTARLVAHPRLIAVLAGRPEWLEALARQRGGAIDLREHAGLSISGAYVESL